jgi:hypothetical protein
MKSTGNGKLFKASKKQDLTFENVCRLIYIYIGLKTLKYDSENFCYVFLEKVNNPSYLHFLICTVYNNHVIFNLNVFLTDM